MLTAVLAAVLTLIPAKPIDPPKVWPTCGPGVAEGTLCVMPGQSSGTTVFEFQLLPGQLARTTLPAVLIIDTQRLEAGQVLRKLSVNVGASYGELCQQPSWSEFSFNLTGLTPCP